MTAAGARAVVGVDPGAVSLRDADAAAHAVVAGLTAAGVLDGAVVATHLVRTPGDPRVTLSVEAPAAAGAAVLLRLLGAALPGSALDGPAGEAGVQAHLAGSSGRLVHFAGVDQLVGTVSVGELLAGSAVEAVHVLGGTGPGRPDVLVVTRDHVRPAWSKGRLVLATEWAAGGTLVPFETPSPTPCCVDHA